MSVAEGSGLAKPALRAVGQALDVLLPPRCPSCGGIVDAHHALCAACWGALTFIEPPFCASCGVPFELEAGEGSICADCLAAPPGFAPLRAAIVYDEASQPMVLRFKFADATHCAPTFASWMARAGADVLQDADWLVPVPLHPWRLLMRRYNQAGLLAGALSRRCGVPEAPLALRRTKRTTPQSRLSRAQRTRNVRGAFAVAPAWRDRLRGKRIVLIDDVSTTGATLSACAATLKSCAVADISSITLARTA